jgi:hypothetical protein
MDAPEWNKPNAPALYGIIPSFILLYHTENNELFTIKLILMFRLAGLAGSKADMRFRNSLNMAGVAREYAEWFQQKVIVKAVSLPVPQNLVMPRFM